MNASAAKVALITGASRGIGRAAAYALAQQGFHIAIQYRADSKAATETLAGVRERGADGFVLQADLETIAGVDGLFKAFDQKMAELGQPAEIAVLVNNAGIAEGGTLAETTEDQFDRQFAVNVKSVFFATQKAVTRMKEGGRIINLSSVLSSRVFEAAGSYTPISAYSATKGAIDTLTRHWAVELGPRGITVNAVAPGAVDTDMNASWLRTDEGRSTMTSVSPLGRVGTADDIAGVIAFLAGPQSRWTTGQVIDASGGYRL
jgi:NAD(P)-dependent dehydrogenase (short-subunit alcohol dehydrogenase family)